MLAKILPMAKKDHRIEGQKNISRHAIYMLNKAKRSFRNSTVSSDFFKNLNVYIMRNGAQPVFMDPQLYDSSFERKNARWNTDDSTLRYQHVALDIARRQAHRHYTNRTLNIWIISTIISIILALTVIAPAARKNQQNIAVIVGKILNVKVEDSTEKTIIKAEVKKAKESSRSFMSAAKNWYKNRSNQGDKKEGEK